MATTKNCDLCNKKETDSNKGEWLDFSVTVRNYQNKIPGSDLRHLNFDICPSCAKIKMPKILNILKK